MSQMLKYVLYIRFIIVDDSGSMMENDGNIIQTSGSVTRMISSSRWAELVLDLDRRTARFHYI